MTMMDAAVSQTDVSGLNYITFQLFFFFRAVFKANAVVRTDTSSTKKGTNTTLVDFSFSPKLHIMSPPLPTPPASPLIFFLSTLDNRMVLQLIIQCCFIFLWTSTSRIIMVIQPGHDVPEERERVWYVWELMHCTTDLQSFVFQKTALV